MRDEDQLEKEKQTERELQVIASAMGEALSKRGIPFVCIIGSPVGNVIRCSSQMQNPINRDTMVREVIEYVNFLEEKYK